MLTQQLREMERAGLVEPQVFSQVLPKVEYSLTPFGTSLERRGDFVQVGHNTRYRIEIVPSDQRRDLMFRKARPSARIRRMS